MPTTPTKKQFIILGPGRSGTTMLRNLLASHPAITAFGELFDPNAIVWGYDDFNQPQFHTPQLYQIRAASPVRFLDGVFNSQFAPTVTSVGFKALYDHLSDKGRPSALQQALLARPGLHVIFIKRRNFLKQYVSALVADERRKAGKMMNAYRPDDVERDIRVTVAYEQCLTYFEQNATLHDTYAHIFKDHPTVEIYYEDLVKNYTAEISKVLFFLDAPWHAMTAYTYKIRQKPIADVVANFDALQRYFADTPWARFFET